MENSIEEAKRIIEKLISTMKSDREMFDEKTTEKEIYTFFINALEFILSDYKRVLKENEKLKNKLLDNLEGQKVIKEETPQYIKENYIPVQKVKDKTEELQKTNFNDYTKKQDGNNVKMEILYEFKKMLESEEK